VYLDEGADLEFFRSLPQLYCLGVLSPDLPTDRPVGMLQGRTCAALLVRESQRVSGSFERVGVLDITFSPGYELFADLEMGLIRLV
jgi:hypothetical protein